MDLNQIPVDQETDRELLRDIRDYGLKEIRVGFSSEILTILDDAEAKSSKIETLKDKLDKEIVLRLFAIANSVRYGKLSAGSVHTFFDVVMRLGMTYTKVLSGTLHRHALARRSVRSGFCPQLCHLPAGTTFRPENAYPRG